MFLLSPEHQIHNKSLLCWECYKLVRQFSWSGWAPQISKQTGGNIWDLTEALALTFKPLLNSPSRSLQFLPIQRAFLPRAVVFQASFIPLLLQGISGIQEGVFGRDEQ